MGTTSLVLNIAQHVGTKDDMTVSGGVFTSRCRRSSVSPACSTGEARIRRAPAARRVLGGSRLGPSLEAIGTMSEARILIDGHAVDRVSRCARNAGASPPEHGTALASSTTGS